VHADPKGLDELAELGTRSIPVVRRGDRYALGMDLGQVDAVVGLASDRRHLSVQDLDAMIASFYDLAKGFGRQLPEDHFADTIPGRSRTYLGLFNHIVGHAGRMACLIVEPDEDYTEVRVFGNLGQTYPELDMVQGEDLREGDVGELSAIGDGWVAQIHEWAVTEPDDGQHVVRTFYGPQTLYELMENTAYSMVQHSRQLMTVLDILGVEPFRRITAEDYEGMPSVPQGVWDEAQP
jgi:hypothetical protein